MKLTAEGCTSFEQDISLFVDHELPARDVSRLTSHLASCGACRDYLDDLRELSSLHFALEGQPPAELGRVQDKHALFASITRVLVAERRSDLARLFYEVGKAIVLQANDRQAAARRRWVDPLQRPVSPRAALARGRDVAKEGTDLCASAESSSRPIRASASLFRRTRGLLRDDGDRAPATLLRGRRFLLAALALKHDLDEARIYLGFEQMVSGRHDRARLEFRRVYREACDPLHRLMALQFIGNLHALAGDHARAIDCYREVIANDLARTEPRFFVAFVNLAMNCAKAGLRQDCVRHFADMVQVLPGQVASARALLSRATHFRALLDREHGLRDELSRVVPALFAA